MWLSLGLFLIRSSTLTSSELIGDVVIAVWTVSVVTDISVVTIAVDSVVVTSVSAVVGVAGRLRVRGTVDIPRLMMVLVFPFNGVKVGASIPN